LSEAGDFSEWNALEMNERSLHTEHAVLIGAAEKLRTVARAEGADEVLDFAERLLMRIRLDEEIFYPAALLIRSYLKGRRQSYPSADIASIEGKL
ncbi:MAG TPA: hypothetical protein VII74_04335, partial [Chthoniobacterales bacterium]